MSLDDRVFRYCAPCSQFFSKNVTKKRAIKPPFFHDAKLTRRGGANIHETHKRMYDVGPTRGAASLLDTEIIRRWDIRAAHLYNEALWVPLGKTSRQYLAEHPTVRSVIKLDLKSANHKYIDAPPPDYSQMFDNGPRFDSPRASTISSSPLSTTTTSRQSPATRESLFEIRPHSVTANGSEMGIGSATATVVNGSTVAYPDDPLLGDIQDEGPKLGEPRLEVPAEASANSGADATSFVDGEASAVSTSVNGERRKREGTASVIERQQQERKRYRGLQYDKPDLAPLDLFQ